MKSKLLLVSLFMSLLSIGQKLPISGICLSDVLSVTGGTCLSNAFTNANAGYFDPVYSVSGNCLNDFRNYGGCRPSGLTTYYFATVRNGVTVNEDNVCTIQAGTGGSGVFGQSYGTDGSTAYHGTDAGNCTSYITDGYYVIVSGLTILARVQVINHIWYAVNCSTPPTAYTGEDFQNITTSSMDLYGSQITSQGSGAVTERGTAYGTGANPTIAGNHTHDGSGTGSFNSSFSGLSLGTLYHFRAYATNFVGTSYGSDMEYTTVSITAPTISTNNACFIDVDNAFIEGTVNSDGGATVTDRGFCYSTSNSDPTTADSVSGQGSGTGYYSWSPSGLLPQSTNIYIRAYATNSAGTSYGTVYTITSDYLCY